MNRDIIIGLDDIGMEYCNNLVKFILDNDPYIDDAYINYSVFSVFKEVITQIVLILDAPSNHDFYTQLRDIPDFNNLQNIEYLSKDGVREYFIELSLSLGVEIYDLVRKIINVTDTRYEIFFVSVTLCTLIVGVSDKPSNSIVEVLL